MSGGHEAERPFPGFEACIEMMHSDSPLIIEDGYWFLMEHASEFVSKLIAVLHAEQDILTRCDLIGLLGESKSAEAVGVLARELTHPVADVRVSATFGLEALGFDEAVALAREYRARNSWEF